MLNLNDITLNIAGRTLISSGTVSIPTGAKVGLVGRNGTGKSTLFAAVAGRHPIETGTISFPKSMRLGEVAQEAPGTEDSLLEIVLAADEELQTLNVQAETETDPTRIAEIQERLVDIDAHSAESRAASILSGLGFDDAAQRRPASSFSGGWRMRVALAAVLFARPDVLLLDEPTNYLDLEGAVWLENFIARYPGTVLIISHDRDLLNVAVNAIVHLEHQKLTYYKGNFDSFERQRAEALDLQSKARDKQAAQIKHMEAFVERFRAKATKARQAQSRLKALEKMKPIAAITAERVKPIRFPNPEKKVASPIIKMEAAAAGYEPDKNILSRLNLRIDADDRIALLGANGNGKSTFAKLIDDRLSHVHGDIVRAGNLRIAMFAQHQLDDLRPEETPFQHVRPLMPDAPESKVRSRTAQMGLGAERMDTKAKHLSGGEKARLLLGLISFHGPHLLILDEPTNHLDVDSREALVHALNDYEGAVIVISHDRHLIEATVDRLWIVRGGHVSPFDGDMNDYKQEILRGKPAKASQNKGSIKTTQATKEPDVSNQPVAHAATPTNEVKRKSAAQARKDMAPVKKKIDELERIMSQIQEKIALADVKMQDPVLFSKNPAKGAQLSQRRAELANLLETRESEWLELSETYEAAVSGE